MKKLIPILTLCALPVLGFAQKTALLEFTVNSSNFEPSPDGSGNYWNNILGPSSAGGGAVAPLNGSTSPVALVDTADGNDGWTLAVNQLGPYGYNFGGDAGTSAGPFDSGLTANWPAMALQDGVSIGNSANSSGNQMAVVISGLNNSLVYNVLLYGNHTDFNGGLQTNTLAVGTSASANSQAFNSHNNTTMFSEWDNITPSGGQIVINIGVGGHQGALNTMKIVEASASLPPSAPTGLKAKPGNAQVALSWTASSGATSYNVKRSTISGGETTIHNVSGVSYTDTTAVNGTTYYYEVSAVNTAGEGANSTEVSATPSASLATTTALINFYVGAGYNVSSPDGSGNYWNNIMGPGSAGGGNAVQLNGSEAPVALVDTFGTADGWSLGVSQLSAYGYNFGGEAGPSSGPFDPGLTAIWQTTALEDGVIIQGDHDANGNQISVTLGGLNNSKAYKVLIYGNVTDWHGSEQTNTVAVGSTTSPNPAVFNDANNTTAFAEFDNVTPSGGQIVINVGSGVWGALNTMEVVEGSGSSGPSPASIASSFNGTTLSLTWPSGQGWRLVSQTDSLSTGLTQSGTWTTVSGASDGSYSVTVDRTQPAVFYKLVNP